MKLNAGQWTKSSRSNGNGGNNCVEIFWKKSSRSNPSGNCVEVKKAGGDTILIRDTTILIRDTKLGESSPKLAIPVEDWGYAIERIKVGALPGDICTLKIQMTGTGGARFSYQHGGIVLVYTKDEWDAFVAGVKDGEFDPA